MSLRSLFSRTTRERFVSVLRDEGLGAAAQRTRQYVGRTVRGALGSTPKADDAAYLIRFWQDMARRDAFHVTAAPATLRAKPRIAMIGDLYLPQCRKYRVAQLAEMWAAAGVDYDISHYADVPRAVALMQTATHLMIYRTQNDPRMAAYLYEARRLRLPVLYDIDDPLFSVSAYETYENMKALPPAMKAKFVSEAPKYLGAMAQADVLTVSTPGLVAHTKAYLPGPVYMRRNFADRETLEAADAAMAAAGPRDSGPFRVAFASGSMGHEVDFGLIAEDIVGFLDAAPDRHLVILGHFDQSLLPESLRHRVEAHAFRDYPSYLETLSTAHCAVMPLTDDLFNRCKSGVRVIDAAAVAVPSIVGTVSDMAALVQDGVTGRVLAPGADWRTALEDLAQDRGATAAMGQAARHSLQTDWTARATQPIVDPDVIAWAKG